MSFDRVSIGDRIDIKVNFRNMGEVVYTTKVLDILDKRNNILSIYRPARGDKPLDMLQGREYEVVVYTDQAMIVFKGYFEGFVKDGKNYFVALRLSNEGFRVQRRDFFRFSCNIPLIFSVIENEDEEVKNDDIYNALIQAITHERIAKTFDGMMKDIGGGGLRFLSDADLDLDKSLRCEFTLGDKTMMIKASPLEKQFISKTSYKFQYRVIFKDIPISLQEEIIKYIFEEQKKQRRFVGGAV